MSMLGSRLANQVQAFHPQPAVFGPTAITLYYQSSLAMPKSRQGESHPCAARTGVTQPAARDRRLADVALQIHSQNSRAQPRTVARHRFDSQKCVCMCVCMCVCVCVPQPAITGKPGSQQASCPSCHQSCWQGRTPPHPQGQQRQSCGWSRDPLHHQRPPERRKTPAGGPHSRQGHWISSMTETLAAGNCICMMA